MIMEIAKDERINFNFLVQHEKRFAERLSYGTAGFRASEELLDSVMFRVGIFVALLSISEGGKALGVVVTASHNPEEDNGLKIVDFTGSMLREELEKKIEDFVNSDKDISMHMHEKQMLQSRVGPGLVVVGRDTRWHSERLVSCLKRGIKIVCSGMVMVEDLGLVTTPVIHFVVREINGYGNSNCRFASVDGYVRNLVEAWNFLNLNLINDTGFVVDCAGGVGGVMMKKINRFINLQVVNDPMGGHSARLNDGCGAEYVQKTRCIPHLPENLDERNINIIASLDGDGDRLVYSFRNPSEEKGSWKFLDGDKIACLFTTFIVRELDELDPDWRANFKMAVIQTAYANGSSTKYFREILGVKVIVTPTGVKHLERQAKSVDIGVYFEANGHGTVLFSDAFIRSLHSGQTSQHAMKSKRLIGLAKMLNQAVGDAISCLLAVRAILQMMEISYSDWSLLYDEIPSMQIKVRVKDRNIIKCSFDETSVVEPGNFQALINDCIEEVGGASESARAFVRPSGTEDVVRIYAEAKTLEICDKLARRIAQLVEESFV